VEGNNTPVGDVVLMHELDTLVLVNNCTM
jgi:hypothetical protein